MIELDPDAELRVAFAHQAFFYDGIDEYLDGITSFIDEGLARGEAVMVVVPAAKLELLQAHYETSPSARLRFEPMEEIGRNPAWIIPAWQDFVSSSRREGRPARGVGELIGPDRNPTELFECERHEALFNLAFAQATDFTLLCPYDVQALDPAVIDRAHRNHHQVIEAGIVNANPNYDGAIPTLLAMPLSPVPDHAQVVPFTAGPLTAIRRVVARSATAAGVTSARVDDVVTAMNEAMTNSILHGGGSGSVITWHDEHHFVCEVRDLGRLADPLAGRVRPDVSQPGGRGLWLIHQLSDLVELRALPDGQAIRMRFTRG